MGILKCENVHKNINNKEILKNINFELNKNEIVGLVGPNGAGKTTLMKLMVGLSSITQGKIKLDNFDVEQEFLKYIKEVGAIIEVPIFYPSLTGLQCLKYYAKLRNVDKDSLSKTIQLVGLENSINSKVKTYSLGMRQRLGVAQAIMTNPKFLILDEPFNGLDPSGISELRKILINTKSSGATVFISSHTLSELEIICDRVIFMNEGKILKVESLKANKNSGMKMILKTTDNLTSVKLIEKEYPEILVKTSNDKMHLEKLKPSIFTEILILLKSSNIEILEMEEFKETLQHTFNTIIGGGEHDE